VTLGRVNAHNDGKWLLQAGKPSFTGAKFSARSGKNVPLFTDETLGGVITFDEFQAILDTEV